MAAAEVELELRVGRGLTARELIQESGMRPLSLLLDRDGQAVPPAQLARALRPLCEAP